MRKYLVVALIIVAAAGAFYWYGRSRDPAVSDAQPTRDYKDATYENRTAGSSGSDVSLPAEDV